MKKTEKPVPTSLVILIILNSVMLSRNTFMKNNPEWLSILLTCLQIVVVISLLIVAVKELKKRKK